MRSLFAIIKIAFDDISGFNRCIPICEVETENVIYI